MCHIWAFILPLSLLKAPSACELVEFKSKEILSSNNISCQEFKIIIKRKQREFLSQARHKKEVDKDSSTMTCVP
jgi:hypothetical protein